MATTSAAPEQRIIIQFTHALSAQEQAVFSTDLSLIINQKIVRAEHSTNERWIVVLSSVVSEQVLSVLVGRIQQHRLVSYAEPDNMLQPIRSPALIQ